MKSFTRRIFHPVAFQRKALLRNHFRDQSFNTLLLPADLSDAVESVVSEFARLGMIAGDDVLIATEHNDAVRKYRLEPVAFIDGFGRVHRKSSLFGQQELAAKKSIEKGGPIVKGVKRSVP